MRRLALERVPEDALDITPRRQQFVPLTLQHLGNAGTNTDGFDGMFTEAAQHAAEHAGFAETLTPDLVDANFVPGQIVESALGPAAKDFQAFTGAGTSVLDDVQGHNGGGDNGPGGITGGTNVNALTPEQRQQLKDSLALGDESGLGGHGKARTFERLVTF